MDEREDHQRRRPGEVLVLALALSQPVRHRGLQQPGGCRIPVGPGEQRREERPALLAVGHATGLFGCHLGRRGPGIGTGRDSGQELHRQPGFVGGHFLASLSQVTRQSPSCSIGRTTWGRTTPRAAHRPRGGQLLGASGTVSDRTRSGPPTASAEPAAVSRLPHRPEARQQRAHQRNSTLLRVALRMARLPPHRSSPHARAPTHRPTQRLPLRTHPQQEPRPRTPLPRRRPRLAPGRPHLPRPRTRPPCGRTAAPDPEPGSRCPARGVRGRAARAVAGRSGVLAPAGRGPRACRDLAGCRRNAHHVARRIRARGTRPGGRRRQRGRRRRGSGILRSRAG